MLTSALLFAYFGPETQLPLLSVLGAVSGLVMMFARSPIRLLSRWLAPSHEKKPASSR